MASWKVSKQGEFGEYVSCTSPKPGDWVSYFDHLMFEGVLGSIIRAQHKTAQGNAKKVKGGYQIRVVGKCKDVKVVIKMLEDYFEPVELKRVSDFPDLPNWRERLKYIIDGTKTSQKK
jgi:hypothetical protein